MPRNKILPPVSFVTDLSNSGNSLIQKLFAKPSQNNKESPVLSFSERLRSQPSESQPGRLSKLLAAKTKRQETQQIDQTDRLDLPQRKPLDHRKTRTVQPPQKTIESQPTTQLENSVSATELTTADNNKADDRLESSNDSTQAASQQPVPAASQDNSENEKQSTETVALQSDKKTTSEESETVEIPATLLKHVVESTKQNGELDNVEQNSNLSGNENSQPPVILSGLANALQSQVLPQQKESEEQVPVPSGNESAEKSEQQNPASNSQEQSDVSNAGNGAATDLDVIDQDIGQSNQAPVEAISQDQIPLEQESPSQQDPQQDVQLNVETDSANKIEEAKQVSVQVEPQQSQPVLVKEQEKQQSQNIPVNDSQNKQNESTPEKPISQGLSPANEIKGSDSINKQKASSELQQPVSAAVENGTGQNQKQNIDVVPKSAESDLPASESTEKQSDQAAQSSDSNQNNSASEVPVHVAQQYQQDTLQSNSPLKQSLGNNVTRVPETSIVDKLTEAVGQLSIGESSDAAQMQKSVQIDPLSAITSTTARSSTETPAAVQARPVLDITRSDMSQKLSSFIQQASESGKAMRIRLDPPELGSLQIEVGRVSGQLIARIEVDNPQARALVFEQLQLLRDSLQQQGLRVDRLEVELNENLSREFTSDQSGNQQSEEQQQRFGEQTEFAAENKQQAGQNEQAETEANTQTRQVVGVSEIDVHI